MPPDPESRMRHVDLCRECASVVRPSVDPTTWAYYDPERGEGCWRCGETTVPLAPMSLLLVPVEPGVHRVLHREDIYLLESFGGRPANKGDYDEQADDGD